MYLIKTIKAQIRLHILVIAFLVQMLIRRGPVSEMFKGKTES